MGFGSCYLDSVQVPIRYEFRWPPDSTASDWLGGGILILGIWLGYLTSLWWYCLVPAFVLALMFHRLLLCEQRFLVYEDGTLLLNRYGREEKFLCDEILRVEVFEAGTKSFARLVFKKPAIAPVTLNSQQADFQSFFVSLEENPLLQGRFVRLENQE